MSQWQRCRAPSGFSLVELMLALSLGLALSAVVLQGLMAESQVGLRVARLMRERAVQRRTLDLIQSDLAQATTAQVAIDGDAAACGLSGRTAVLHLKTSAGLITYSIGAAPSRIWRGAVLMRCGPAYGLDGWLQVGSAAVQRVVLDGLAQREDAVAVAITPASGAATLTIQQELKDGAGQVQRISTSRIIASTLFQ